MKINLESKVEYLIGIAAEKKKALDLEWSQKAEDEFFDTQKQIENLRWQRMISNRHSFSLRNGYREKKAS